jgi:cell division septation protein DedD
MPKNEDGEFELILGNRQLLSVFFIVVVLLGVFFTMGYIVGRNSGPLQTAEVGPSKKESKPMVIESPVPPSASSKKEEKPVPEAPAPKPAETKPPEMKTSAKATAPEQPKTEPIRRPEPPPEPSASPGTSFLQLTATTQHEAEVYADVLKKKGFKAITATVPDKPGLVRVLVGPIPENAVAKTRADLVAAGFPGDKAIKR